MTNSDLMLLSNRSHIMTRKNCVMSSLLYCGILASVIVTSWGHGRLVEPPSRASMFRYGFNTPPNYNDNQLFCGGFTKQWGTNGGQCGVCGDDFSDAEPRAHEGGGVYATGTIAKRYTQGALIDVRVEITAQHKGWFEFRLCPHNDPTTAVTHDCLNRHLLTLQDGSTRAHGITVSRTYSYKVQLPADVVCTQCVFQWKYHTGNSWGVDPDGTQGLGKGPQEEFYACADIAISSTDTSPSPTGPTTPTTRTLPTTTTTTGTLPTTSTPTTNTLPTTTTSTTSTLLTTTTTTGPSSASSAATTGGSGMRCRGGGLYVNVPGMDFWCSVNCPGNCPASHCTCDDVSTTSTTRTTSSTTSTTTVAPTSSAPQIKACRPRRASVTSQGKKRAKKWCKKKCQKRPRCKSRCICT